ncbi:MAG: hypothetical protein IKS76_00710 [Paludibacteraceae bacterium]|nr:hypothetical protein [Paludibacteraceae bacterium]MBR6493573.1 hypothetical protein [Paludibacteraceae bacterium]
MSERTILWIIIGAVALLIIWKIVKWVREFRDFRDTGDSGDSKPSSRPHSMDSGTNSHSWSGGTTSGGGAGRKW